MRGDNQEDSCSLDEPLKRTTKEKGFWGMPADLGLSAIPSAPSILGIVGPGFLLNIRR
jgi:hypothetical protein